LILMVAILLGASITKKQELALGIATEGAHLNEHFLLFTALCVAFFKPTKHIGKSFVFATVYGVLVELYQFFLPYRSSTLYDAGIDALGALLGVVFLWKLLPILPKKLKNLLLN